MAYNLPLDTASLVVTLYYQTASREYIDFLGANGGVDGFSLKGLWESSKSPPQVIAQTWLPNYELYLPIVVDSQ